MVSPIKLVKTMERQQNIEYPDITTLHDAELILEGKYLLQHIEELSEKIQQRAKLIARGYTSEKILPTRMMIGDLKHAMHRQQAIIEEIEYRAEMMR